MSEHTVSYGWLSPEGSQKQGMSLEDAQKDVSHLYDKGYIVYLIKFIDGEIDESFEGATDG